MAVVAGDRVIIASATDAHFRASPILVGIVESVVAGPPESAVVDWEDGTRVTYADDTFLVPVNILGEFEEGSLLTFVVEPKAKPADPEEVIPNAGSRSLGVIVQHLELNPDTPGAEEFVVVKNAQGYLPIPRADVVVVPNR